MNTVKGPLHGALGCDDPSGPRLSRTNPRSRPHERQRKRTLQVYNARGGKNGEDEERGRERDRYNERDRNRD